MTLPFGIDISKYQSVNDYAKIKESTAFVFVKATESWGYVDPKFVSNWQGLAGHNRGAYCYVYLSEDPLRQANHLIDTVTKAGADWRYDRLVLDLEKSGHGLSKAEVARRVLVMMERIKEVTGRYPILYSRADWVNNNMLVTDPRIANADWWLANYLSRKLFPLYTPEKSSPPLMPRGVSRWLIHQTGERGNGGAVGVGSYYVDTNRWNGTSEQVQAYFGFVGVPPEPPDTDPEPIVFDAKVITSPGFRLKTRYTPAGEERPETDWLNSGDIIPVYETAPGWYRTAVETWASAQWLSRIGAPPTYQLDISPLWQRDPRWKDIKLGNSYLTLGSDGCLVTVLSMVAGVTPDVFNARLKEVGGFDGPRVYWQMVDDAFPDLEYVTAYDCYYIPAPLDLIDDLLSRGISVPVHVLLNGLQHWVLITGKTVDDYVINDPWYGDQRSFKNTYGDPARWIFRIRAYRRQA